MLTRLAAVLAASLAIALPAAAKPPLEAYGEFPEFRSLELSPDGTRVAYLRTTNGVEQLMIYDLATKKSEALATTGDFKTNGVSFPTNDYVILHASKSHLNLEFITDRFEHTSSYAVNLKTRKVVQLLTKAEGLHPAQSGLGEILGFDPSGKYAYMPAYVLQGKSQFSVPPTLDLLVVNLDTGAASSGGGKAGSTATRDWVLNAKGEVIAREDWSRKTEDYSIRVYENGNSREIFEAKGNDNALKLVGLSGDGKSLIVANDKDSDFFSLYEMSLADGKMKGPLLERSDADISNVILGKGREVLGVAYAGMYPSYDLFDEALEKDIKGIQSQLSESSVRIDSMSDDHQRVLLFISGGSLSERYVLFDRKARSLDMIAFARPAIKAEDIGKTITIEYKAADGLKIPALITWPAGVAEDARKNLPLIVMPHGGPESYDSVRFDWLAQYFASQGYMVFQPNFRGSGGFGKAFAEAGHGEWGRKMESDITDGVRALIKTGWADESRMCILGWSYGGYAALAGGAMTPDLYKCVVSVAGVSNLYAMLGDELRQGGPHGSYKYWVKQMGDPDKDRATLDAVSPVNLAANYKAPVLLIHADQDLTVPVKQSDQMQEALKRAGKDVTYLKMKSDDHSLSNPENRKTALEAMSTFVAKHIGAK